MIFRVVIVAIGFVSRAQKPSSSAPGWFKQRRPLFGKKPRRHQTAIRDQAADRSQPATALLPHLSLWGNFGETLRPRNLSVPRAGQAKRRARFPQDDAPWPGAFAAESRPRRIRDRHRQRIGSVRNRLGTWAASAGSAHAKPRSTARRPIQAYEVEPSAPVSHRGIASHSKTQLVCSLRCASVRRPARHAGPRLVQLLFMIGISGRIGYCSLR